MTFVGDSSQTSDPTTMASDSYLALEYTGGVHSSTNDFRVRRGESSEEDNFKIASRWC